MSLNSSVVTTPQVGSNTYADPTYIFRADVLDGYRRCDTVSSG